MHLIYFFLEVSPPKSFDFKCLIVLYYKGVRLENDLTFEDFVCWIVSYFLKLALLGTKDLALKLSEDLRDLVLH